MPGIKSLGLADRYEQVARLRLTVLQQSGTAVLDDLSMRGHPGGMSAACAETLLTRDPEPAWDHDRFRGRGRGVGDNTARRVDPDGACNLGRHPGRVGGKDAALIDDPGGAGVCLPEFLDHLNIRRQVKFRAAQSTWQCEMKHARIRQGFEKGAGEFPRGLNLLSVEADLCS